MLNHTDLEKLLPFLAQTTRTELTKKRQFLQWLIVNENMKGDAQLISISRIYGDILLHMRNKKLRNKQTHFPNFSGKLGLFPCF